MAHFDPRLTPWLIDESDFYEIDDTRAQKEFLLRYAVLAPSGHNTQPWSFRITDDGIEVYADYTRSLPIADPANRELLISVGAAITNLRVAAAHFGFESSVLYGDMPVALVTLRETCDPDPQFRRLFGAITTRHTTRADFDAREIDPEALDKLCGFIETSDHLRFIVPHERTFAAELVEEADRTLMADEKWRAEVSAWVRPNESESGDGLTGDAFGIPGPLSAMTPWLVRTMDVGATRGKQDRESVVNAAGLIVVTGDDDAASLIRTGETLEQLLLVLTSLGIRYAFLNQPIQVPTLRTELHHLIRTPKPPQIMIRIGYASGARPRPMPRRPLESVTT